MHLDDLSHPTLSFYSIQWQMILPIKYRMGSYCKKIKMSLTMSGTSTVHVSLISNETALILTFFTDTSHVANSGTVTTPRILVVTVSNRARVTSPPAKDV
jgi:hypothetical protein